MKASRNVISNFMLGLNPRLLRWHSAIALSIVPGVAQLPALKSTVPVLVGIDPILVLVPPDLIDAPRTHTVSFAGEL